MGKRGWLVLAVVALAGVSVLLIVRARRGHRSPPTGHSKRAPNKRVRVRRSVATHWVPYSPLVDAPDPAGSLRLEGQVIDAQSHGVAKATVTINSSPPRTTVSEDDGSFVFDKLIGREYKLRARAGTLVGGPIKHRVRAKGEPVIIRMRQGITLEVSVVAAAGRRPIAKATVAVDRRQLPTDSAGKALFEGVSRGYVVLAARAAGYGTTQQLFEVPAGRSRVSTTIALSRGAVVSGVVKDDKGSPVAGATVRARDLSKVVQLGSSPLASASTDKAGAFRLSGVARGTYRFIAHKTGFAAAQSAPLAVDGLHDRSGVTITLRAGATLAGRVVHADKSPAAAATVKVRLESGTFGGAGKFRRTVTDQRGAFELSGLPRRRFAALAYTPSASSSVKRFDLRKADVKGATFELTVSGEIAGTVVDGAGQPVSEAQVSAVGDFWGGAKLTEMRVRGSAQVMTDGAGGFRFRGLPTGKYRLRASRSMRLASRSGPGAVAAKTGDMAVKIVLRANGGAKGVLRFEDGKPATAYTVSPGFPPVVPVVSSDGAFELSNLRPGKYDVSFHGAAFVDKTVRDVVITPGKVTDMGSITVDSGRSVSGRVLDAKGAGVANAAVVLGSKIVGDGAHLALELGASADRSMGLRRAASKEDGSFEIRAVGAAAYVIAAEHAEHGRSRTLAIPAGSSDRKVALRLSPFGSVSGVVKLGSAVAPDIVVVASSGTSKQVAVVRTGADGGYMFERLPAGAHTLTAMAGRGASASTGSKKVVVTSEKPARADITIEVGEIDLAVTIVAKTGKIDATQVFLFTGKVSVTSGAQINQAFLAASKKGGAKMAFAKGASKARFTKIRPGNYSICAIPITGDMNNPLFAKRLQAAAATLQVHCRIHVVASAPRQQSLTLPLPPMAPLPDK